MNLHVLFTANAHFLIPSAIGVMAKIFLVIVALVWTTHPASAIERTWVSGDLIGVWSDPDNWDPAGVPQNGDGLIFETGGFPPPTGAMVNDLTNLTVQFLSFPSGSWQLSGNELGVNVSIDNKGDGLVEINCAIRLDGTATFSAYSTLPEDSSNLRLTGPINLNNRLLKLLARSDATVDLAGPISGNGSINLIAETVNYFCSPGTVKFSGTGANTFNGPVFLSSQGGQQYCLGEAGSRLVLDKQSAIAVTGTLDLGHNCIVELNRPHQIADNAAVSVGAGALFLLHGNTETIGSLSLAGTPTGLISGEANVDTGGATLSVVGNITSVNMFSMDVPRITGKLGLPPGNHVISVSGNQFYGLEIPAQILGDGGFTKTGTAGLILSGNNIFYGEIIATQGVLEARHDNAFGAAAGSTCLSNSATLILYDVDVSAENLLVRGNLSFGPDTVGSWLEAVGTNTWSGPIVLDTNLVVTGYGNSWLDFNGVISGPGGLRLLSGPVQISGAGANTFTGSTVVQNPLLLFNKSSGVAAYGGPLIVGGGAGPFCEARWLQDYQRLYADVTIHTNGLVNLNNHWDDFGPITFYGGEIQTGTGELGLYGLIKVECVAYPFNDGAAIHGRLGFPPGYHEFQINDRCSLYNLVVDAAIAGSGHLRKTGPGAMWLYGNNSYSGLTVVDEGVLIAGSTNALGASGTGTTVNDGTTLCLEGGFVAEPIFIRGSGVQDSVPIGSLFANGALQILGTTRLRNPFPSIFACLDLTTNATIRVETNATLTADGFISGIGPLTKSGAGSLVFSNANANTYSGNTIVADGTLRLAKPNNVIAVPGDLVAGPAPLNSPVLVRWAQSGGMNPTAIATVNAGSLLDLNGFNQTLARLNLNDGGDAQTGAGSLNFGFGGMIAVGSLNQFGSHSGSSITGNLGLPANATLTFAVGAYAPSPPFDFNPELDVSAAIPAPVENTSFERAGIAKNGPGTLRLSGSSSFNGRADVLQGTLIAAGSLALGSSFDGTVVFNSAKLALEGNLNVENEVLALNSSALPAVENLSGDNYWSGPVILNQHSTVGVAASSGLQFAGVISGAANFTKIGPGTLRFGGGDHNTYTGETFINEGIFLMSKPLAITSVPGPLSIGTSAGLSATAANLVSYQVVGNIFVNRNGLLNLNGQVENVDHLWLMEGGDVQTTTGVISVKTGGSIQVFPGSINDPATISGILEFLAGAHNLNVAASSNSTGGPDLDIPALVTSSGDTVTLNKLNNGKLRFSADNNYVGSAIINAGVLQVDGSQPGSSVTVNGGARLAGTGRTGPVTFGSSTGIVAPGASPGNLQVGHFNLSETGGILELDLNGTTPGTSHDRLMVRGLADLTGMSLQASVNFAAATNDQFQIVGNDFFDLITGEFNGLPEGTSATFGDHVFQITYTGGDGNDVVLTKIADVFRPVLRIERVPPDSVRLLWATSAPPFSLQANSNLTSTNWTFVAPPPVIVGSENIVTNPAINAHKFYRLIRQ